MLTKETKTRAFPSVRVSGGVIESDSTREYLRKYHSHLDLWYPVLWGTNVSIVEKSLELIIVQLPLALEKAPVPYLAILHFCRLGLY